MGNYNKVCLVFMVLLICFLLNQSQAALPLSLTGRRMMGIYKRNGAIGTGPSHSRRGPGGQTPGGKMMSKYKPNGDIYTAPSGSGHGGGHIRPRSSP